MRRRLDQLFDDGTGRTDAVLVPFVDALAAMDRPGAGLGWLESPSVVERIRAIATGEVALSHDGIDTLRASIGREHLRELLITHGVLPARDRYLAAYERWAALRLADIDEPADRRLIAAYLRWHHGPRLGALVAAGKLTESQYAVARAQTNIAVRLLEWLRSRGSDLASCSQGDIDTWFAGGPSTRMQSRAFLRWAIRSGRCPPLSLPIDRTAAPRPVSENERLDLLARFLGDDTVDLVDRVAGCLVLLYALPASRISRLRLTDIQAAEGGLTLRIADDLLPVPAPLDALIGQLAAKRRHIGVAGHPDSDWMFPGRCAGQHLEYRQLAERLNRHGITRAVRSAALDALLATVPAPVLAKVLDRDSGRVAARSRMLGTDWRTYAALRVRS